jgi:hypothetical protein
MLQLLYLRRFSQNLLHTASRRGRTLRNYYPRRKSFLQANFLSIFKQPRKESRHKGCVTSLVPRSHAPRPFPSSLVPTLRVGTPCPDAPRPFPTRSVATSVFPRRAWEQGKSASGDASYSKIPSFPCSAWERPAWTLRVHSRRGASQQVCSHAERGNKANRRQETPPIVKSA